MKPIVKIQARLSKNVIANDVAAMNTLETVLLIIAVLAAIGLIFALIINYLVPTEDKISNSLDNAPMEMFEEFYGSVNGGYGMELF